MYGQLCESIILSRRHYRAVSQTASPCQLQNWKGKIEIDVYKMMIIIVTIAHTEATKISRFTSPCGVFILWKI
jgi:hypothetical protein